MNLNRTLSRFANGKAGIAMLAATAIACMGADLPRVLTFTNRIESFTNAAGTKFEAVRITRVSPGGLLWVGTNGTKGRVFLVDLPETECARIGVPVGYRERAVADYEAAAARLRAGNTNGGEIIIKTPIKAVLSGADAEAEIAKTREAAQHLRRRKFVAAKKAGVSITEDTEEAIIGPNAPLIENKVWVDGYFRKDGTLVSGHWEDK